VIIIGTPHTKGAGYFMNDDRPAEGKLAEADIRTCPHCQAVIKMAEWAKAPTQNFCIKCMAPACNHEACVPCVPFIQRLEQHIASQLRLKRILGV
jgi:hypothetical protein